MKLCRFKLVPDAVLSSIIPGRAVITDGFCYVNPDHVIGCFAHASLYDATKGTMDVTEIIVEAAALLVQGSLPDVVAKLKSEKDADWPVW